ncbi:uncharacterized protein LOC130798903 [Amaranthus tricolor]|uniref:uncharacterized protein LOC130798903 n=1 Tax=Amaranthus tricolor TaxID=29722 RepID=UPI002588100B|nr:uncharacterized protein LOC130798903 [Amaranthus tricolor]
MDSRISPNFVPNYNHELFVGHGDNTNHSLSTKHLNGLNFEQWERSVQISLVAKNKMGFVDGSCRKPADPQMTKQWELYDKMVISWLLNSCEENISSSVLYCNSTAYIWKELKNRFSQSNGPKILQIDKELNSFEQGNLSIAEYFTKLKSLWDAYDSLVKIPKCSCALCTCDVNGSIVELIKNQRLYKFLMGLNGAYKTVRGNILMIKPVPDVNTAYSILIQDETQREFSDNSASVSENNAFAVNRNQFNSNGNRNFFPYMTGHHFGNYNKGRSGSVSYQFGSGNGSAYHKNQERRSNYFCEHCKMQGHTIDKCFKTSS